jgi:AraC family transcriptional regulator of adaptative response/methylated-DNA-[protein]-cysteine methyltransferase
VSNKHTASPYTTEQSRWEALVQRDPQAEGVFWYAVRTTGVYCRPTCASRLPRQSNVCFFDSPDAAEQAGFRACKRCQPRAPSVNEQQTARIQQACAFIDAATTPPRLHEVAAAVGLSSFHFQRLFKQVVGVSPRQYAAARQQQKLRDELRTTEHVTEAMYNAGFESSSSLYQQGAAPLGMTPSQYQAGAHELVIHFTTTPCYLGWLLVAATPRGICAIHIGDAPADLEAHLRAEFAQAQVHPTTDPAFAEQVAQVAAFIEAPAQGLDLPLDIQGTAFQQRVWEALQAIPAGQTTTYTEVAARIGQPTAARAVAQACAANRLAVAIPCHRVVRSDGTLSGYRWGTARKQELLAREAAPDTPDELA